MARKTVIIPSKLAGSLSIPPSKSQTLRALLFASLSHGTCRIKNPLISPDTCSMIQALSCLGATIYRDSGELVVIGTAGKILNQDRTIDCGNSGLVLRLIGALSALSPAKTTLFGDASIQNNRPILPLTEALRELGATITYPLSIQGPLLRKKASLAGQDSQPVSGLLIAAAFAPHPIEIYVTSPGEKPWVDLTLHWFDTLNIPYERKGYSYYRLKGNASIAPFTYTVPADWSSLAFPLAAALITESKMTLHHLNFLDPQGDRQLLPLLEQMGARFTYHNSSLEVHPSLLKGVTIDVNPMIDALPILSVIGCFATGKTVLYNGAIARKKESDRIASMAKELSLMGACIEETPDGLIIYPSKLYGAQLHSHKDHRVALSLSVAGLAASSPSELRESCWIDKTYHTFYSDMNSLGAHYETVSTVWV